MKVSLEWFVRLLDELNYMDEYEQVNVSSVSKLYGEAKEMFMEEMRRIDSIEDAP